MINKTAAKLYAMITQEAVRLMLVDGLTREEAFRRAVPKHFEDVAVEENRIPSHTTQMVWIKINELQDKFALKQVAAGRIRIALDLGDNGRGRTTVYDALDRLRDLGLVYNPTPRTWSRVEQAAGKFTVEAALAAIGAAAD